MRRPLEPGNMRKKTRPALCGKLKSKSRFVLFYKKFLFVDFFLIKKDAWCNQLAHGPPETGSSAQQRRRFSHFTTMVMTSFHFVNVSRKQNLLSRNIVKCRIPSAVPWWSWPNILSQMKSYLCFKHDKLQLGSSWAGVTYNCRTATNTNKLWPRKL